MPTTEERREAAEKLRDIADCEYISDAADFGMAIKRTFREMVPIPRSDRAFLRTIADLIEPEPERTCEMEFNFPQEVSFKQIDCRCSECWHGMSVHDHYCAECGAKVVE